MPDDPTIHADSLITDPAPVVEVAPVRAVPPPAPKKARTPAPAKPKATGTAKAAPAKTTAPLDPTQAIALHCLHPSQYVEHMPCPGKDVTVEWVKARLVYRERLDEILASGAYEKTAACPHLPHDPRCGR